MLDALSSHQSTDLYFLLLIFLIAFLLMFSFSFAIYTIYIRIRDSRREVRLQELEKRWQSQILEIIAGRESPDTLINSIDRKEIFYFVEYVMRYMVILRGDERKIVTNLALPFLDRLTSATRKSDPESRAYTIRILSTIGFDKYDDIIINGLNDTSPLVAMVAAHALVKKGESKYINATVRKLHKFGKWSKKYLATMLASAGSSGASELRRVYSNREASIRVRLIAAEALLMINDFASADIAAEIISTEYDYDLISTSLKLLSAFGQTRHISQVRRLCSSTNDVIRAHALSTLGSIGDISETDRLYEALTDPSPWVVLHAARGMANIGAIDLLREIAASNRPEAVVAGEVLEETKH